ncbi:TELO2-interacting protein 2 [Dunckerocampus dactyliophorus]|uniref:TELO2-interacting protein 2 n=1 Tax=Dunckerocampus dactyliophorus TaxID=161453 RepID=UPI0024066423|nr:TELO2-interacting protein 2 [Dunckerocampus dactyliophorus]
MDVSSLLDELHLCTPPLGENPLPSSPLPPITSLLVHLQRHLIGGASDKHSLIGYVARLFQKADAHWLFSPASAEELWAELEAAHISVVCALIGCAALAPCDDNRGLPPPGDYRHVPALATQVCSTLQALLGRLEEAGVGAREGLLLAMAPHVCVFAVTHFQEQAWSDFSSRRAAQSLQGALLKAGSWTNSAHLLMGNVGLGKDGEGQTGGILGGVLDVLQPQLTKESWRHGEAAKLVFAWTLLQVTRPALAPHLPRLLPCALLLSDHHAVENCMLGVRCLHHILLHTPACELRQYNRGQVVYQALFKHLYTSEDDVIQRVLECMLDLLLVLEKPPSSAGTHRRKPSRHDDVLRLLLTHMEGEHKVLLRRVYASVLPAYLNRMGVAVCRHLRRLERILIGYLEISDPPDETSRLKVLEALQITLAAAWPRFVCRVDMLLPCLLRLLVDVSRDPHLQEAARHQLTSQASRCVALLHAAARRDLQQVDSMWEELDCLTTVTMATES